MKKFSLTVEYSGEAESWEEIRNDAENNKIPNVFIGSKEFVNVVRCKDCIMVRECRNAQYLGLDGFCSNGERKEQADD